MAEFRVLGPVELWAADRLVDLGPAKQRAVVVALLLEAGRPVPADTLIDRVWDEEPPAEARNVLYSYVSRLRRVLAQATAAEEAPPRLERGTGGYLVHVDRDQVDLFRFRRLVEQARAGGCADEQRAALLREAIGLWRGEPLAGLHGEWVARVREGLQQLRLDAVVQWAQAELRLGRPAAVIDDLREQLAHHRLAEPLMAELIRALYLAGRGAEALDCYAKVRQRLADEFGVEPGPELRQLHEAILRGTLERPASAPAQPGRAAPGQPAASRAAPAQLPADMAGFTGRAEHLARLDALLPGPGDSGQAGGRAEAVVISAIAGTAGVGKTALAVHWAHRVRDRFGDGQLYVNLRGYARAPRVRPIEALAQFLHALGVASEQVPVDVEEAAGLYRTMLAGKRMLVVLDNADSADQVRPLLPGAPGCLVLVTSRDRLAGLVAREGAQRLNLDVLTPDEAHALLARILGQDRVAAEPEATAELARVCAYLPLALRIAAANLTDHPQRSIGRHVTELLAGDRLAALEVEGDEQAAVRIAFGLSYSTLPASSRRLFRLLGLVPGPHVTPDAAAALAGTTSQQAAQVLDRLAGTHLITQHGPGRFAFHDLLRLYAAERAQGEDSEQERDAAAGRLFDWYLNTVDNAARLLYPEKLRLPLPAAGSRPAATEFGDHTEALAWLDAERLNLLAAIRHAGAAGPRPAAWLLADALRGYFWLRMSTVEWLAAAHAGLAAAEADDELRAQAVAQLSLADAYLHQSRYQQAVEHFTRALTLSWQTGWLAGQATVLCNLGLVYWQSGRLPEAADRLSQALVIARQTGQIASQAVVLGNLGIVYSESGRLRAAADHLTQALALDKKLESRYGLAIALTNLGETFQMLGQLDHALDHLTQALALQREIGNRSAEADTLRILAAVHRDAGDHARAVEFAGSALALARDTGDRRVEADALNSVAATHHRLGRHREAIEGHQRALDLARELETRYPEVVALIGLAASERTDQPEQALAHAHQAAALACRTGYRMLEGQAATTLADIHLTLGAAGQAVEQAEQALAIHGETGHRLGQVRALVVLGDALRHTQGTPAALPAWRQALTLAGDIGAAEAGHIRTLIDAHAV